MRTLHLVDPGSRGGGGMTLRLLGDLLRQRGPGSGDDVLLIGHARHAALARRCGVEPTARWSPPRGLACVAARSLHAVIGACESQRGRYDLIHAWSLPAAAAASVARPRLACAATIMLPPGRTPLIRWMVRAINRLPMPLLVPDEAIRCECLDLGLNPSMLSVVDVGVDVADTPAGDRARLRHGWRVPPDGFVIGSFAEPLRSLDARVAAAIIATLPHAGRTVRLVIHSHAARRLEAARWLAALGLPDVLLLDDACATPWLVLPGLDAVMFMRHDRRRRTADSACEVGGHGALAPRSSARLGVMPILWSMAAGVPVITEQDPFTSRLIEHGAAGFLVAAGDGAAAAQHLLRLADDPSLRERVGRAAQASVMETRSAAAFAVRIDEAVRRLAHSWGSASG